MALTPKEIDIEFEEREKKYIRALEEEIDTHLSIWYNPDKKNTVTVTLDKRKWNFRSVATKLLGLYSNHWFIEVQVFDTEVQLHICSK